MLLTLAGTALYGYTSVSVTRLGVVLVASNCLLTVTDRLIQRHLLSSPNFTVTLPLCMVVNNTLGILPVMAMAASTGEMRAWATTLRQADENAWYWVGMSSLVGCCLGYLGLKCQQAVSATTFLMLQNATKMLVIVYDMALMHTSFSVLSAIGCCISLVGAIWYGSEQLQEIEE